jgi:hypothetical protein
MLLQISLLALAIGCNKKPHEEPTTEPSAALVAPSAVNSAPIAAADSTIGASEDTEIEVPEDLADDAAEEITPQNLDNELATLEKEIGNDS